jgi:predicted SAM-dependent methyltransferase
MNQFARKISPSPTKKKLKLIRNNYLWLAFLSLIFELQMVFTTLINKQAFRRLTNRTNIRLNLGCGSDIRLDWVNIDMIKPDHVHISPNAIFITHDLRRNIPLPDASCSYVYSSHFWEHLDYFTGFRMMQESYRILEEGSIFRIVLPDFEKVFKAYAANDVQFFEGIPKQALQNVPGSETLLDYVHYAVYQFGEHLCLYDSERTCKMLLQAGFSKVEVVEFDETIDINLPLRTRYSLYVEAIR